MFHGELGENLSIKLNMLFFFKSDKGAICHPIFSKSVIEANNPEASKRSLLGTSVAIGVCSGFYDSFFGGAIICFSAPFVALGHLEDILSSFVGGNTAFYSGHSVSQRLAVSV